MAIRIKVVKCLGIAPTPCDWSELLARRPESRALSQGEADGIPPHSGRARRIIRDAALEIRLARYRGAIIEEGVVLRARLLTQEPRLHTPVTLNRRPRLVERLGIFDSDADFGHVATVDQLP